MQIRTPSSPIRLFSAWLLAGCLTVAPHAAVSPAGGFAFAQELPEEEDTSVPVEPGQTEPSEEAGETVETEEGAEPAEEVTEEEPAKETQEPSQTAEEAPAETGAETADDLPTIYRELSELPFPARKMHELISEAAASGDIDKLRAYIGTGSDQTMLSFGSRPDDPIEFLKSLSGDEAGYEILAILKEVLESGFIKLEEGSANELYVWPYFYGMPLDALTPAQRVEMYRLLTHGDYEDMRMFGAYVFYRLGITPQGRWQFFVAGD